MKRKTIILGILGLLLISGLVYGTVSGYQLLTANSHFQAVEGIEIQYLDNTSNWVNLPVDQRVIDLAITDINPGETNIFYVRARNIADSGELGLTLTMDGVTGLSHEVICMGSNSTGTTYTFDNSSTERNDLYVKLPSIESWKVLGIKTTADGALPIELYNFTNRIYRDNALSSYVSVCE